MDGFGTPAATRAISAWDPAEYEEENIVCPATTAIGHWFARLDGIGQANPQLGSYKWVDERDIDDLKASPMIASGDPIWGIQSMKEGTPTIRHIDTQPKFDASVLAPQLPTS